MEDCVFCKIARGEIPADTVLEDEEFVAFKDIDPKAPVHVLVIPRRHVTAVRDVGDWDPVSTHGLLTMVGRVAEEMGLVESGYRLVANAGPDSGQEVPHLHLHVLGGAPLGKFW